MSYPIRHDILEIAAPDEIGVASLVCCMLKASHGNRLPLPLPQPHAMLLKKQLLSAMYADAGKIAEGIYPASFLVSADPSFVDLYRSTCNSMAGDVLLAARSRQKKKRTTRATATRVRKPIVKMTPVKINRRLAKTRILAGDGFGRRNSVYNVSAIKKYLNFVAGSQLSFKKAPKSVHLAAQLILDDASIANVRLETQIRTC